MEMECTRGASLAAADINQEAFGTRPFSGGSAPDLLDELTDQAPASTVRLMSRASSRSETILTCYSGSSHLARSSRQPRSWQLACPAVATSGGSLPSTPTASTRSDSRLRPRTDYLDPVRTAVRGWTKRSLALGLGRPVQTAADAQQTTDRLTAILLGARSAPHGRSLAGEGMKFP
jgi:hypothetical protein